MRRPWMMTLVAMSLSLGPRATAQSATALTASLSITQHDYARDADVEVTVTLTNGTARVVDVPAQTLQSAILLLDVRDAAGRHVATMPPPVPRAELVSFRPGEKRTVKVTLGVFSPPLRAGDYAVGPASAVASGAPVPFRIR